MLKVKSSENNIKYNKKCDILYITLDTSEEFFGQENEEGIVLNYDFQSKKLVGIDIWDFEMRMKNNEPILLPPNVKFDFSDIRKNIIGYV